MATSRETELSLEPSSFLETDGRVQPHQHVPYDSHTPVTNMKGTDRVNTGELDLHFRLDRDRDCLPFPPQFPSDVDSKLRRRCKVQKPWTSDFLAGEKTVRIFAILEDHLRDSPVAAFWPFAPIASRYSL